MMTTLLGGDLLKPSNSLVPNAKSDEERASMEKGLDDLIAKWK
jgi:hypothetical protein